MNKSAIGPLVFNPTPNFRFMHALVKKNPPASASLNLDTNPRSLCLISDLLPPYFCLSVIAGMYAEYFFFLFYLSKIRLAKLLHESISGESPAPEIT